MSLNAVRKLTTLTTLHGQVQLVRTQHNLDTVCKISEFQWFNRLCSNCVPLFYLKALARYEGNSRVKSLTLQTTRG